MGGYIYDILFTIYYILYAVLGGMFSFWTIQAFQNFLRHSAPISHQNTSNFQRNCIHFQRFAQVYILNSFYELSHLTFPSV